MKLTQIFFGLLIGHLISRLSWALIFFTPAIIVAMANVSAARGSMSLIIAYIALYIVGLVLAILVWFVGNGVFFAFWPRTAIISAILSALVTLYVAPVAFFCSIPVQREYKNVTRLGDSICNSVTWRGLWF